MMTTKKETAPDFVNIQREHFHKFLKYGIIHEINLRNPIKNEKTGCFLFFYPEYYQFCKPEFNSEEAMRNGKTYAGSLYIPVQFTNMKTGTSTFQWILMANMPLMTSRGHFILNGSPRVIINQMVRSPGIYYSENVDRKGRRYVYADLIPKRGTWLRFEKNANAITFLRMKRTPKIPVPLLLEAMGVNTNNIIQQLKNDEWFKDSLDLGYLGEDLRKMNYPTSQESALISLYAITHPKQEMVEMTPKMGQDFLYRKFLNPRTYDLGTVGRERLNKKLNLSTPQNYQILTGEDILRIIDYLSAVFKRKAPIDDIDHLKNRRIRTSGEILQNQFAIGLTRFEKITRERLSSGWDSVSTKSINAALREFFGSSQLSQFLDQTNPLAEITHKRRFTSLGPSGVSRETAGMAIRSIHPTYYGRICPIETPEGQNAGLVNSPTILARVNSHGFLESPFQKVLKGQPQSEFFYLAADQEEKFLVAPGDIKKDSFCFLGKEILPARKEQGFCSVKSNKIQFLSVAPLQMISVATSLIPFLEHDDANRALMGSNMQRQAVPLFKPEKPIVRTGYESRVVADIGHTLNAKYSGYIHYVSSEQIRIYSLVPYSKFGKRKFKKPKSKKTGRAFFMQDQKLRNLNSPKTKFVLVSYKLKGIFRSNQDTYQYQRALVKEGQWIEKGDVLADGSTSSGGVLSLGQNLFIGYLPWEGYNFEDAVLISEKLVKQDVLTSLHVEKYEIERKDTRFGEEIFTRNMLDIPKKNQKFIDPQGIIKLGAWVHEGDILVGKVTPMNKKPLSPHERLLYDIVGKKAPNVKDSSLRVPKGLSARVVSIRFFDSEGKCYEKSLKSKKRPIFRKQQEQKISNKNQKRKKKDTKKDPQKTLFERIYRVQILLTEKRRIQVGDKIAGRHGNKGIVSRILPTSDMPYLPNGIPLDIVLNPLGIPSRMNVGQVYECLLGLAGYYLKENYQIKPFDEVIGPQASRSIVYQKLYQAQQKTKQKWLFNPNFPGKTKLFDGRTGDPFDQPIMVGKSYILKLVHQVEKKIHARSTGPYSLVTQQPLRGRAKHGGQRLGEMEVWALEGFGAAYTLQELLTVKSDDMKGRHKVLDSILTNVPMQFGTPESFKVLVRELQSLCLDIGVFVMTEKGNRYLIDIVKLP